MVTQPTQDTLTYTDEIIQGEANYIANTYNRPPFMLSPRRRRHAL